MASHPPLRALIEQLLAQVAALQTEVPHLRQQQTQINSRNSSKPPSSDFHHQGRPLRPKSDRRPGGQKGHPGTTLRFSSQVDQTIWHRLEHCGQCGHALSLQATVGIQRRQVFDLPSLSLKVTEHRAEMKRCPHCQSLQRAVFPAGVTQPTQYGPQFSGLMVYLHNYQLLPFQRLQELAQDLWRSSVSPGSLVQMQNRAAHALERFEQDLKQHLSQAALAHFDETGCYQQGRRRWVHVASTTEATYYAVDDHRGKLGMEAAGILPAFRGIALHDHFDPYQRYEQCQHSYCNAHHLRELTHAADVEKRPWAEACHALLRDIKTQVDSAKAQGQQALSPELKASYESRYRQLLLNAAVTYPLSQRTPGTRGPVKQAKSKHLLDRLLAYQAETLRFMHDFRVPFTNNQAERDLRMLKVQQKISGSFRSTQGTPFFHRIRAFISTTKKRRQHVLTALTGLFLPPQWKAE